MQAVLLLPAAAVVSACGVFASFPIALAILGIGVGVGDGAELVTKLICWAIKEATGKTDSALLNNLPSLIGLISSVVAFTFVCPAIGPLMVPAAVTVWKGAGIALGVEVSVGIIWAAVKGIAAPKEAPPKKKC